MPSIAFSMPKSPRAITAEYDDESMWLQLRQIIEAVAFSAIVADEDRSAALRREQDKNSNYVVDGKVGKILEHLSKISPHFLAQAIGPVVVLPSGTKEIQPGPQQATLKRCFYP